MFRHGPEGDDSWSSDSIVGAFMGALLSMIVCVFFPVVGASLGVFGLVGVGVWRIGRIRFIRWIAWLMVGLIIGPTIYFSLAVANALR